MKKIVIASVVLISLWILWVYAAPSTWPNGENPSGLFAVYLNNIATTPCTGTGILIWFSSTPGADFLKGNCVGIGVKLAAYLGSFWVAPAWEAVIGFDATTGAPTFGSVAWGGGSTAGTWQLGGNSGTVPGTDFIWTSDAQDIAFKTNNNEVFRVRSDGTIIGISPGGSIAGTNSFAFWSGAGSYMGGNYNFAIGGYRAGMFMEGTANVAMGWTMAWGMRGYLNTAIWWFWPANSMVGNNNVAMGWTHAGSNMNWAGNVAIWWSTSGFGSSWSHNVTIWWHQAGLNMLWANNVILGGFGGGYESDSYLSVVVWGSDGGRYITGRNNAILGGNFAGSNLGGAHNTAIGGNTVWYYMTWRLNTAIWGGYVGNAMVWLANTAIGGYNASITNNAVNYSVVIWSGAVSNQSGAVIITWNGANVGIGTSNPSEKLDVNGITKATAFIYSSDARLKTDITSLTDVNQKISALNGVSFRWKSTGDKDIGFIAQDVEKILPDLVHTGNDGMKSVAYGNITALLVEGYKYQKNRADELEKRIEVLENMMK